MTAATDEEVCAARQIGELVAKPLGEHEHLAVHKVLTEACQRYFGGSLVGLSRWVGLNKSTIHGWMSGAVVPELARLVELALKLRIGLRELVVGDIRTLPASLQALTAGLEARTRQTPDPVGKRARLQEWLVAGGVETIHGIAAELKMSHRDVYYYVGDAAQVHVATRREQAQAWRVEQLKAAQDRAAETLGRLPAGVRGAVRLTRDTILAEYPKLTYSDLGEVTRQANLTVSFGAAPSSAAGKV